MLPQRRGLYSKAFGARSKVLFLLLAGFWFEGIDAASEMPEVLSYFRWRAFEARNPTLETWCRNAKPLSFLFP